MKKLLILSILFLANAGYSQVNFVRTTPQASVALTTLNDLDTLFLRFPHNLTSSIAFDSSKANKTILIPSQDFVAAQGKFTMYFTRTAINGSPDSFRVWVKKIMPASGAPIANDSTFIVGGATTYANILSNSGYNFTITDPTKGLNFFILKGDGGSLLKVRLNAWIDFTQ